MIHGIHTVVVVFFPPQFCNIKNLAKFSQKNSKISQFTLDKQEFQFVPNFLSKDNEIFKIKNAVILMSWFCSVLLYGLSDLLCKRAFLLCFLCFGRINLKISLNTDCFYWCPFKISNDWTRGRANVLQTRYYPLQLLTPDQTSQRGLHCATTLVGHTWKFPNINSGWYNAVWRGAAE
jgi:hypothetical protein